MTRLNTVEPSKLTDPHLLGELHELPRLFKLARPGVLAPPRYTMGTGHVLFFYAKTAWASRRHAALIAECLDRGFKPTYLTALPPIPGLDGDWEPDAEAIATNLARLRERLHARLGWYKYRGKPVGADFYDR